MIGRILYLHTLKTGSSLVQLQIQQFRKDPRKDETKTHLVLQEVKSLKRVFCNLLIKIETQQLFQLE